MGSLDRACILPVRDTGVVVLPSLARLLQPFLILSLIAVFALSWGIALTLPWSLARPYEAEGSWMYFIMGHVGMSLTGLISCALLAGCFYFWRWLGFV